ncbi:RNA-dependent RNA polymerase [Fusarium poae dsRNA virus 2]|uniref:RNA-directed RNA polymerase n=1 Tax=Fusarium poae dsRNA virus 2 TaxID=1848042 RepID=A0A2Z1Q375_9VIRU|nr:RNA-dependent RNA polymerase [Fusarium poae dsRNA virus 2]ANE10465.1 RNA-dependent RNA polymerase [Fusarium poae dsRNA virus 2]
MFQSFLNLVSTETRINAESPWIIPDPLIGEIAQVLTRIRDGRHKMRDGSYFYDFSRLYDLFELSKPPDSTAKACAASILLHPTPSVVYNYIPSIMPDAPIPEGLQLLASGGLVLNSQARQLLRLLPQPLQRVSLLSSYNYYENHGVISGVCIHRALHVLGLDNRYDHNELSAVGDHMKLGIHFDQVLRLLAPLPPTHIKRFFISCTSMDEHHSQALSIISTYSGDHSCLVFVSHTHISFALNLNVSIRTYDELLNFYSHLPKGWLASLEDKYPKNTGRPGGKILVNWPAIASTAKQSPAVRLIIKLLLAADNDWELVIAFNLTLLPFIDDLSEDIVLWLLHCNISSDALNALVFPKSLRVTALFNAEFTTVAKAFKEVHTQGRLFSHLLGFGRIIRPIHLARGYGDLVYGFDTLAGRSEKYKASFVDECLMRSVDPHIRGIPKFDSTTKQIYFDEDAWTTMIKEVSREVVSELLERKVALTPFHKWYDRRMFWGASGGSPGTYANWSTGERLRLNKRGALLVTPEKSIRGMWDQAYNAVQWSVGTIKFESGKIRHILTTGLYNYISQAYILDNFESNIKPDTWYSAKHHSAARVANHIRRLEDLQSGVATMFDFSDYNLEHTFYQMLAIMKSALEEMVARGRDDTMPTDYADAVGDLLAAGDYVMTARARTFLNDKLSGLVVRIVRGLQSGERSTSFFNTLCNKVDSVMVDRVAEQLFGRRLITHQGDRLGDDVFVKNADMKDSILMCALFNLLGSSGQLYKITSEYCSPKNPGRGEFLRHSYDGASGRVSGYPIRAIVGFVHGEFFSEPLPAIYDRAATILEQVAKIQRRGCTLPMSLVNESIRFNCRITKTLDSGIKKTVVADPLLALTPAAFGGIGVTRAQESQALITGGGSIISVANDTDDHRYAFLIPSGEGKSSLARLYPNLFVDHDDLISVPYFQELRANAVLTGTWKPVNTYLRSVLPSRDRRILLTWSQQTVPHNYRVIAAFLLQQPSALRANIANRETILKTSRRIVTFFPTHQRLEIAAVNLANALTRTSHTSTVINTRGALTPPPTLTLRINDTRGTLKRARVHLSDDNALNRLGLTSQVDLSRDVLDGVMSGGYPKPLLRKAVDAYANDLLKWTATVRDVSFTVTLVPHTYDQTVTNAERIFFRSIGANVVNKPLSQTTIFRRNREGYPMTSRIVHYYSCLERLILPSGFSIGAGVRKSIQCMPSIGPYPLSTKIILFCQKLLSLVDEKDRQVQIMNKKGQLNPLFKVSHFTQSMQAALPPSCDEFIMNYITGDLQFIPPANRRNHSSDFISLLRDVTLSAIESDPILMRKLALANNRDRVYTIYQLEDMVALNLERRFLDALHVILSD